MNSAIPEWVARARGLLARGIKLGYLWECLMEAYELENDFFRMILLM